MRRKPHCLIAHQPIQTPTGCMPDASDYTWICARCGFALPPSAVPKNEKEASS
jgi:hypothetical protein